MLFIALQLIVAENQPTIEHITSDNGLSHNTIRCILQDTTGFLWFGSLNGLNRYDGIKIKTLNPENKNINSLSSGKIKELHKDSRGYIWIRTYTDIIHCYNPYNESFLPIFKTKTERTEKHNLFYEDREKNIWLGGNNSGCVKISIENNKVETKTFSAQNKENNLPSNTVNHIFEDSKKTVWILTSKGIRLYRNNKLNAPADNRCEGMNFLRAYEINHKLYFIRVDGKVETFDIKKQTFDKALQVSEKIQVSATALYGETNILISTINKGVFMLNTRNKQVISSTVFAGEYIGGNAIFQTDQNRNVWMYNMSGNVWLLHATTFKTIKLNLIPANVLQLIDEERYQFKTDKYGNTWISTYGNGLFRYNLKSNELTHFTHQKNTRGISSNYILSILIDKNDNIWIGTESMGINKLSFANRNVKIIFPDPENRYKNGNVVRSLLEDSKGNIWVGTKSGSLYKYNADLSDKKTIFENGYNVYSMLEDKYGSIWLGTRGDGLLKLSQGNYNQAVNIRKSQKTGSLSFNGVFSFTKDRKDRLWVATFGGGLNVKISPDGTEGFRTFFNNDEWIRFIRYVFEDKSGDIWVATTNGILRFNPDQFLKDPKKYKYYNFDPESENSLSNPEVRYIFQDSKNNIWLATAGGGLNKFVAETASGNGIFIAYKNQQGISNDNIMAISEDDNGLLWISTESGLHTFNPESSLFQYFKFTDDFSSNMFSESTNWKCRDGRMLWGSLNGFYVFHPQDLNVPDDEKNKVILTGFFIYDLEAEIGNNKAPLKKSIAYSDKIILKASDKVFHIEFSNLNFRDPKANQFMFILENYEKRWNTSGTYNFATYRNVPPGKYIFKVKSLNSRGAWSEEVTSLTIVVKPPFWLSTFAFIIYFVLIAIASFFAFRIVLKFNRLNNAVKVERQLTDYKLRFFTNISHEFRTPLTLIKGSVDTLNEIKNKLNEPLQQLISDMDKNTNHLLRLIEQLLEFRKLQNNKQKLNLQQTDAVVFLKEIYSSFSNVAHKMNIEYRFIPSHESMEVYIDKNKVDKIVFNLLSNAFKFTPRGGIITMYAETDETTELLKISVADNGIGVPKDKQNQLFSRFMQINFSATGTGIGLSLVNEFCALHKGSVSFSENEGGGSIFSIQLPLNKNVYEKDDFVNEQVVTSNNENKDVYSISEFIDQNENEALINLVPHTPMAGKKYKILVIDDNDDIREFLDNKLSPHFEVITAVDGTSGIEKSMNDDPDLIICDVMMPGMNGFDLTRNLKDNFATCHIPVILLTAYISDEHHIEGIEAGADAYISKPFSMKHLILQINKLLEKRELLHKHYASNESTENVIENTTNDIPEKDAHFMQLVEELLDMHLTNPEFSVDEFANMTNTGRTLFFKKIKSLTGYSPNEFIRFRRMKKAAELLKTYKYNVSEVSYMVGINDPFYFSKCFKAQFGCSPSKYLNS